MIKWVKTVTAEFVRMTQRDMTYAEPIKVESKATPAPA